MRNQKSITFVLLVIILFVAHVARAQEAQPTPAGDDAEKAEIERAINYVPAERIEKLQAFLAAHPNSNLKLRAQELIVSARAALGDEKLRAADTAGGLEQFRLAVKDAPEGMTDKLYAEVISRIPFNLFLLGQRAASLEVARLIEAKVKDDPKRLLMLVNFYTTIEDAEGAARVSEMAIKLAPEMAAAHQALALSRHIGLQLDAAATEYARAVELDPKLQTARRSLADLRRAQGRPEDALALYRELLQSDPTDRFARAGVVLALLDLGKKDDAERELQAALTDEPRNLQLLTGAAYWYVAHGESSRGLELAQRAVEVEPRYVWAQVALARALIAGHRPLAAEQALRFARRYGRFPTLDYELANALYAAGLYTEAAAELARTFTLRNGQIETQLAGRTPAHAANFIELLAPERLASIFQTTPADTAPNAQRLRALLAFNNAVGEAGKSETVKEREAVQAAQEFAAGDDEMRAFRQLYVADRLLRAGVRSQAVIDFAEAAGGGINAAVDTPAASVATLADDLYSLRLQANSNGTAPPVPDVERGQLVNILRGRVEEIAGWVLYHQDKMKEAVARLKQAASLLPENSVWWRTALWHLGAALEASGDEQEALANYLRSYDKSAPDAGRRAIIEKLYRKLNGSLDGLEAKLGAAPAATTTVSTAAPTAPTPSPIAANQQPSVESGGVNLSEIKTTDSTGADSVKSASDVKPNETAAQAANSTPDANRSQPSEQTAGNSAATQTSQPETASTQPTPDATSPGQTQSAGESGSASQSRSDTAQPAAAATPEPTPVTATTRPRRKQDSGDCSFSIDKESITIKSNGGTGTVTVSLSGTDKITPTTRDWPDITVFAESLKQYGTFPFIITSISKRPGRYTVNFNTPCGSKDVTVIVK